MSCWNLGWNLLTTRNVQGDFLLCGFFCEKILEDRHGGDVVRFEYRLSFPDVMIKTDEMTLVGGSGAIVQDDSTTVGSRRGQKSLWMLGI